MSNVTIAELEAWLDNANQASEEFESRWHEAEKKSDELKAERDRLERERDVLADVAERRAERYRVAEAALAAERERSRVLAEALAPFANVAAEDIGDDETDRDHFQPIAHNRAPLLTVGDLRRAATALQRYKDGEKADA